MSLKRQNCLISSLLPEELSTLHCIPLDLDLGLDKGCFLLDLNNYFMECRVLQRAPMVNTFHVVRKGTLLRRGPMSASCWLSHRFEYTRESAGEERRGRFSFSWLLGYLITG